MNNINTSIYWNNVWLSERNNTWRKYPMTFSKIVNEISHGNRILDVGCGIGILLNILNLNNYVEGIDISNIAIEKLSRSGIKGIVANVPPLPYKSKEFDVIIASEFLEHIDSTKMELLLIEFKRVAKKLIVTVPNNVLGPLEEKEHYQKFTYLTLYYLLHNHFDTVRIDNFLDLFSCGKKTIALPTLIAVCENTK